MRLVALFAFVVAAALPAHADEPVGLEQQVRALALQGARGGERGTGSGGAPNPSSAANPKRRVEVEVGQLDPRLKLAPCDKVEPYLPGSATLWGRTRIGLRCVAGTSRWNVFLPVTVKVFAPGVVAAALLPAGAVLAGSDLTLAEVDLAEDASPALMDPQPLVGRTLVQPLKPGQSLRDAHLKPRLWFSAGETIQVVSRGDGFSAAIEAQALTPGIEGQLVRARHESGRLLSGRAVAQNRMELGP